MTEGEQPPKQRVVQGSKKPPDETGIRWKPIRDKWKKNRIDRWVAISTKPAIGPPDELSKEPSELPRQRESIIGKGYTPSKKASKEERYPTFIEKSQPTGNKD